MHGSHEVADRYGKGSVQAITFEDLNRELAIAPVPIDAGALDEPDEKNREMAGPRRMVIDGAACIQPQQLTIQGKERRCHAS